MSQVLGHRSRPDLARHTATNSPPRAGFFVPAVCVSFCFLARLPFRQRMRPGAYIRGQCLCGVPSDSRESAEKRPRESTLSRTRNMWRGGRAPFALPNVPRTVGRAPWAAGPAPSTAGRVASLTSLNVRYRQLTEGPVGPSPGARHCWLSARPVARGSRGGGAARPAASRCMFFTNSTEIKRYEFEKTRKWEER